MTIHTTRTTTQTRTTDTWTTDTETTTETTTTTSTTRTTTRTRKAPAAASEPAVQPEPPAAPPQAEVVEPDHGPPWPPGPSEQDVPEQAETAPTEVFEGVTIPVGSVHPRGGYVHCRPRRQVLAEALDLDIPPEVPHHPDLLTEQQKPSEMGFKRTEALIVRVREARDRGEDPAPLWAQWMPRSALPAARKPRKAA